MSTPQEVADALVAALDSTVARSSEAVREACGGKIRVAMTNQEILAVLNDDLLAANKRRSELYGFEAATEALNRSWDTHAAVADLIAREAMHRREAEQWRLAVGKICDAIPASSVLKATGSIGDLIDWIKTCSKERDALAAEVKALREDVELYRWLRDKANFGEAFHVLAHLSHGTFQQRLKQTMAESHPQIREACDD